MFCAVAYICGMNQDLHFIDKQAEFDALMEELRQSSWFAFDTEFIGEKTYVPLLCLIQVLHGKKVFLIDTITIKDIKGFTTLIEDPNILKITHAGDNDYRLLNQLYGVVPKHIFDTQVAAGFIGFTYPAGFGKIVAQMLSLDLGKGYAVAQWDKRPLDEKVLQYAVEDVLYLNDLYTRMTKKLDKLNRVDWVKEELQKWEQAEHYENSPIKDLLSTDIIYKLRNERERIFLLRLYEWRKEKAETENLPKEHILAAKYISTVVKSMKDGKRSLQTNRTIPDHIWMKHFKQWQTMYEEQPTQAERDVLKMVPPETIENPEKEWLFELIYHLVKKCGVETGVSPSLLLSRTDFNKLKSGDFDDSLLDGWRGTLLGPELVHWLRTQGKVSVTWEDHACVLRMKN